LPNGADAESQGRRRSSEKGSIKVDARFDQLDAPAAVRPEYLTYVLWAITPEECHQPWRAAGQRQ
jgi:hypothetical protein